VTRADGTLRAGAETADSGSSYGERHGNGIPAKHRMTVFAFIIIIVGLVTCGEVMSKFFERQPERPAVDPGSEAELAELRERVEDLTDRVERLTEEQRFMTRLLESAPSVAAIPTPRDRGIDRTAGAQSEGTD